jgi:ATP-dependent exoDNAse (exonuclease V) beta subunit
MRASGEGDEAEAVLICMPKGFAEKSATTMEEWLVARDLSSEAIRVLYVAATRARRLLAIPVPGSSKPALQNTYGIAACRFLNAKRKFLQSMWSAGLTRSVAAAA